MIDLKRFLTQEIIKYTVYPKGSLIFNAFDKCSVEDVKVVILGQDPYHGQKQAMGLSFSVFDDCTIPPSLRNIYKELNTDINMKIPNSGDLSGWASQGVLLLNSILTVRSNQPASHRDKGWEIFTDEVIKRLSTNNENIVYLLWGKFAQSKEHLIDSSKHLILKAAHPSPFSANNGFFGCKHFSKANQYLKNNNRKEIKWEKIN